jgi:hypothetical protein
MNARPDGHTVNPSALTETRRKGWPMTLECFADAAAVLGVPLWVPGTDAGVAAGMHEMRQARRQAELQQQSQRYRRAAGLLDTDPGAPAAQEPPKAPPSPPVIAGNTANLLDPPKPEPAKSRSASEMSDEEFAQAVRTRAWRR